MADEKTFFEHGDVKVTNARFVTGGQTYAMSNVTSVKTFEKKPSRVGGLVIIALGVAVMVPMTSQSIAVGAVIAAGGIFYMLKQKTLYHIMLSTSAGETSALNTHEKEYLSQVVGALNEAIVQRG